MDVIKIFPDYAGKLILPTEVHSVHKGAVNAGLGNFMSLYFVGYSPQFVNTIQDTIRDHYSNKVSFRLDGKRLQTTADVIHANK